MEPKELVKTFTLSRTVGEPVGVSLNANTRERKCIK